MGSGRVANAANRAGDLLPPRLAVVLWAGWMGREFTGRVGIQEFGKAGILDQVLEVGIVTGLETKGGIDPNGGIKVAQRIFEMAGEAIQGGQSVGHVVR